MLVVRQAQLAVLEEANWNRFLDTAYEHCRECFPAACHSIGDEATRYYVRAGIDRAKSFRLKSSADLLGYLNLVFTFGLDFDQLPWAAEILYDPTYLPNVRISMLTDRALVELEAPSRASEESMAEDEEEPAEPANLDPFADWEEAPPVPTPPAPALQPPGESCVPPPPPDLIRHDEHFRW